MRLLCYIYLYLTLTISYHIECAEPKPLIAQRWQQWTQNNIESPLERRNEWIIKPGVKSNFACYLPGTSASKNPEGYKGKQCHLPGNTRKVGYNRSNYFLFTYNCSDAVKIIVWIVIFWSGCMGSYTTKFLSWKILGYTSLNFN